MEPLTMAAGAVAPVGDGPLVEPEGGDDGLASYVTAFARVFRDPVRTGRQGRPR